MIEFFSETDFNLKNEESISKWIEEIISKEGFQVGDITYVFCSNEYLHKINIDYLNHDTLTDIISFDYSIGKQLHGEIYISIEMVIENAKEFNVSFENELLRVIIHGVLHFMGYKDKTEKQKTEMRQKEDQSIESFSLNS